MIAKMLKRVLLFCLTICLSLTQIQIVFAEEEQVNDQNGVTTDAIIIADNYSTVLSDQEKAILENKSILTNTFYYQEPTGSDDLITIDPLEKMLYAKSYTDTYGNLWVATSALLIESNDQSIITITDGQASYSTSSDNYRFNVVYKALGTLENQQQLLNTPYYLVSIYEALEALYELRAELNSVCDYVDELVMLTDGTFKVKISDKEATQAILDLNSEVNKNKELVVTTMLREYASYRTTYPQQYIYEQGALLKEKTETLLGQLKSIVNCEGIATVIAFAPKLGYTAEAAALDSLINGVFAKIIKELESILSKDNWTALDYELLNSYTDADLLPLLVDASDHTSKHSANKTELSIASTTISKTMNQHNVTVKVYANVISRDNVDSRETKQLVSEKIITLDNGISAKEVLDAIEKKNIEEDLLEAWYEDYQVGTDYYNRVTSTISGDLVSDIEYTITYTPKEYAVTGSVSGQYPYGYNLKLPKSNIIGSVIDYAINDGMYDDFQGTIYRIVGKTNILSRVSKQRSSYRLLDIIAKDPQYNSDSNDIYTSIMTNKAIDSISVEYSRPDENDQLIKVTTVAGGYTIEAKTYSSGVDGMTWVPVSYQIDGRNEEIEFKDTTYSDFATGYVSGVTVKYALKVTRKSNTDKSVITDDYVLTQANIPSELLEDAPSQIAIIRDLVAQKSNLRLGSTIYTALGALSSESSDKEVINAINILKNNCFDKDNANHLYVYEYIQNVSTDAQCLATYYEHYDDLFYQVELLDQYLAVVIKAPEFEEMLENMEMEAYISRLDEVQTLLTNVYHQLKTYSPNEVVDPTNAAASQLFETLAKGGTVNTYTSGSGTRDYATVYQATDGKVSINVQYNVLDSDENVIYTDSVIKTYEVGYVLTQEDIDELKAIQNSLYVSDYNQHYMLDSSSSFPSVGTELNASMILSEIYVPRMYKVYIKDVSSDTQEKLTEVSITNTQIVLKGHPTMGYRYDYTIGSQVKSASTEDVIYAIPLEEFETLFSSDDSVLIIERKAVNISAENVISSFNAFNNALGNDGTKFVLVENAEGEYAFVLRYDLNDAEQAETLLTNFATELLGSKINYLALGQNNQDHAVWGADSNGDMKLSIQALFNGVLESGIEMDRFINVIDKNGNINEDVSSFISDYKTLVIGNEDDLSSLGGMLIDSTLYVGDNLSVTEIPFYISIQDFDMRKDTLKAMRQSLVNMSSYLDVNTGSDRLNVVGTLSEPMYQMMLAYMLFNGYIEIENISDIDVVSMFENLYDQVETMVVEDGLSSTTLENTMEQLGVADAIENPETIDEFIGNMKLVMQNVEFTEGEKVGNVYYTSMNGNVLDILSIFGVELPSAVTPILREKELSIPTSMTLSNFYETYEASIIDDASSTKFTTDLSSETIGKDSIVIITSSINDTITFDKSVSLNLNGQYVSEIKTSGNATVQIYDSSLEAGSIDSINGNFVVRGGTIRSGLEESMLLKGYEVNGNTVESMFYTLTEQNGAVMLSLKTAIINALSFETGSFLDTLTYDLAMRLITYGYPNSSMKIDDYTMYEATKYEDLIKTIQSINSGTQFMNDALEAIDCGQMTSLLNDLVTKLIDFETLSQTIAVGKYNLNTTQWNTEFVISEDDYITVRVTNGKERESKKIFVKLSDEAICQWLNEMKQVTTFQSNLGTNYVSINSVQYNQGLNVDLEYGLNMTIDYTERPEYTKLLGIILAQGNDQLIEPLKSYISTGNLRDLTKAFDATTEADMVQAFKNSVNKTYTELLENIGISETSDLDFVEELYSIYKDYITLTGKMLESGKQTTMETYKNEDGNYVMSSTDQVTITLCPFAENFIEMTVTPHVNTSQNLIYGYTLDTENNVIILDLHRDGLKESEINEYGKVWFNIFNAKLEKIEFENQDGMISNGETISLVLRHAVTGEYSMIEYQFKVLGDVNGNGLIENNDILLTYRYYLGYEELDEHALWAADVNGNGFIENNDTLKMQCKWLLGQEDHQIVYTSILQEAIKNLGGNN